VSSTRGPVGGGGGEKEVSSKGGVEEGGRGAVPVNSEKGCCVVVSRVG
jgi:hypothetical protein